MNPTIVSLIVLYLGIFAAIIASFLNDKRKPKQPN